ncbi:MULTISPECIES: ATP-binding protein [unclassified Streptomyces]|uniref:ATP-binding protein n=1 Tax=unclassified Streptomyces TaxID=2593676 RepID=UPI00278C727D|nr:MULTISPECIES: ATP-binding protein [unclassified Streptomyces]
MNHVTDASEPGLAESYGFGLTVGEHSARHLRRILRIHLTVWELPELADDAELALTELIANVVRHVPGRRCTVRMMRTAADGVRVEVSDAHPVPPVPQTPHAGELAESGRGLAIVAALVTRWGVVPHDAPRTGKTVWFECVRD